VHGKLKSIDSWWRRGVVLTSLGISTKLLYVGPR